jgi:predicted metalloprotease with PDZ domain
VAEVTVEIAAAPAPLELVFPAWLPGAYEMRYFGKEVSALSADENGRGLRARRVDASRFLVDGHAAGAPVRVRYRITASLATDDGAELDADHAYINPGAIVPFVRGLEARPHQLGLSAVPRSWRVLGADGARLEAASYLALIDQPIEAAPEASLAIGERRIAGARFTVVIHAGAAKPRALEAMPRVLHDLAALVEAERRIAGPLPFSRYLFLLHLEGRVDHLVALEHAAATTIVSPPMLLDAGNAFELAHVAAHEIFHAWNARRIVPLSPSGYELEHAQGIASLWITEGLTEYASLVALRVAGLISDEKLGAELEDMLGRARYAERAGLSLADLARLAFSSPSALVADPDAYYAAGHAVSMALVAELVARSQGKAGLEQLIAALLPPAGTPPRVVDSGTLAGALDSLAPAPAGTPSFSTLVHAWVEEPFAVARLLPSLDAVGLHATLASGTAIELGFVALGDPPTVMSIDAGLAYSRAGGQLGDRLLRVEGRPVGRDAEAIDEAALHAAVLHLEIDRGGTTQTLAITPRRAPDDRVHVELRGLPHAAPLARLLGVP